MREIKFRVWDNVLEKYCLDTEDAHLYQNEDFPNGIFEVCAYGKGSTAEQFTSLKDRNGKEVYEGDIVRFSDLNYKVYWDSGEFRAACPYYHKYHSPMLERIQLLSVCEVIGNIHENPELLND